MLVVKCISNNFLTTSAYVRAPTPPQQNICYVKAGVYRNWKQLFLSVAYSLLSINIMDSAIDEYEHPLC